METPGDLAIDPYEVLGIGRDATSEEIEAAYRRQARRWHPDVNPSVEAGIRMQRLNVARDMLSHAAGEGVGDGPAPMPVVEPGTIDFGAFRPACQHLPVTVRLGNAGGPASTLRIEPEGGMFWSLAEVRGGRDAGDLAELDFEVHGVGLLPGTHREEVRVFLDDRPVRLRVAATLVPEGNPAAAAWASAMLALVAGGVLLFWRDALAGPALVAAVAGAVTLVFAAAAAGRAHGWPANWSAVHPTLVWFDERSGTASTLHHHLPWPQVMYPAGRRWTSARVSRYAATAGAGRARAVFTASAFESYTGHRPASATSWASPGMAYVYVPFTARLTRGAAERTIAHQVSHLAWPPYRHDPHFFYLVQQLVDAERCPGCRDRLVHELGCDPESGC